MGMDRDTANLLIKEYEALESLKKMEELMRYSNTKCYFEVNSAASAANVVIPSEFWVPFLKDLYLATKNRIKNLGGTVDG